jgi:hypothetical protein
MANKIQLRRDQSISWSNVNPILSEGEPGFEIDSGRLKIGDSITNWNDLPYLKTLELPPSAEGVLQNDGNGNISWAIIPAGFSGNYAELINKPDLKTVATTGSYNDLSNKPNIPSDISDLTDTTNKFGPVNEFNAIADKLFGFDFGPIANVTADSKIEWILLSIDVDNGTITSPVNIDHDAGTLI